ncbi:MAG TPA: hypothetical protein VN806_11965 [Caulobacteraceae bacterium]|nr:hypothetical protein [Caulobacteraceae bacterium]
MALEPNDLVATQTLALMLFERGAMAEAEVHARNAVRLSPTDPRSHNLMGMIMTEAQRPQVGEHHYRRVMELTGGVTPSCSPTSPRISRTRGGWRRAAPSTRSPSGAIRTCSRPCSAGRRWRRRTATSPAPRTCWTPPSA